MQYVILILAIIAVIIVAKLLSWPLKKILKPLKIYLYHPYNQKKF